MTPGSLSPPAPINESHALDSFDCGVTSLNDWLRKRAVKNERSGASRTYVLAEGREVIGYYCLATGAVDHADVPNPVRRNMPDPIPVLVLGRLAVDRRYQSQGLGHALLRDAVMRAIQVADIAGVVALLVHTLSDEARRFYLSCGFTGLPSQPMTLCLMMRTAENTGIPLAQN